MRLLTVFLLALLGSAIPVVAEHRGQPEVFMHTTHPVLGLPTNPR